MFTCEQCGKTTSPGEKANIKVAETRDVVYPGGHSGKETVREIKVCEKCSNNNASSICELLDSRTGTISFVGRK